MALQASYLSLGALHLREGISNNHYMNCSFMAQEATASPTGWGGRTEAWRAAASVWRCFEALESTKSLLMRWGSQPRKKSKKQIFWAVYSNGQALELAEMKDLLLILQLSRGAVSRVDSSQVRTPTPHVWDEDVLYSRQGAGSGAGSDTDPALIKPVVQMAMRLQQQALQLVHSLGRSPSRLLFLGSPLR